MRTLIALVAVTALAPAVVTRLPAQEHAVTPTLLRILGETVASCRPGPGPGPRPIFLVADYRFPHEVVGHFSSRAEAERVRARSGSTFGVFGPYKTPAADPIADAPTKVVAVSLIRRTASGRTDTLRVDPEKVDALFFSMSAVDKFVMPHYSGLYGPEYAHKLRQKLASPGGATACHGKSRMCWPGPGGSLQIIRVMDPRPIEPVGPIRPMDTGVPTRH
jgi:hypothetical protein